MFLSQVENLLDDQDFKTKVTRDDLEGMCADIFEKIAGPVNQALAGSEMTMVSVCILLGLEYTAAVGLAICLSILTLIALDV